MEIKVSIDFTDRTLAVLEGLGRVDRLWVAEEVKPMMPTPEPGLTREEIRAVFVKKNSRENRGKLKAILTKYGVESISSLDERDFAGVMKDLEAI